MNKVLITFLVADFLFLATAGLLVGLAVTSLNEIALPPTIKTVARDLLLKRCPLKAAIINAIVIVITFVVSLPAVALTTSRGWLKAQGWMIVGCAVFTLILGLDIWLSTLKTRSNLAVVWGQQTPQVQSLLQQTFNCCGYLNSTTPPFVQDSICTNALVAAQKQGCVSRYSNFANGYLDIIFTSAFGIVALDVILLLCIAMVLKDRREQARYRAIDEKTGFGGI
jgi:hypothetical protein